MKVAVVPALARYGDQSNAKDFDVDYIKKMVSDHEDIVKLFAKEAKDGEDVELVGFARQYLPELQRHLEMASDLKRLIK